MNTRFMYGIRTLRRLCSRPRRRLYPPTALGCGAVLAAVLSVAPAARADLQGFRSFSPTVHSGAAGAANGGGYSTDGAAFVLTGGGRQQATAGYSAARQRITSFAAAFTYRATDLGGSNPGGDGIAFVVQNDPRGASAIGDTGNGVGYAGGNAVTHSVAVRLGIFPASGESIAVDGAAQPSTDTVPVNLRSGHPVRVTFVYDGASISETLKDEATGDTYTAIHDVDIPAAVGGTTARIGFTGASGDATAHQTVSDFTFTVRPDVPVARRRHAPRKPPKRYTTRISYVDPLIGTAGGGNVYPGAVAPFGMVQFSPDTRASGIGYTYEEGLIQGFSLTHMSGVGCDDFGDVFLTATTGPLRTDPDGYQSPFSHRYETASPGYYQVRLVRPNVDVELTATERAGVARFTFPANKASNVLIPISHTLTYTRDASVRIVGDREIVGQVSSKSFCGANQFYTVYFVMELDRPFRSFGTFSGATVSPGSRQAHQAERQPAVGAYVRYPAAAERRVVTARIGISFVGIDGARRNLQREVGVRGFDAVRRQTEAAWEKNLGAMDVTGGTPDQRSVFYTALYHCLLMPNLFSDVDGRYLGFDNRIHQVPAGHAVYANYSGWDIYRTEAPLLALIAPQRMEDMCQSIVLMYQQGGWIDRWPQANTYTNVMCGSPLTSVMATAWNYGLRGFDMRAAYPGMFRDATQPAPPGKPYAGESNVAWMDKVGYIPDDKEGYGSVSQTEEDCYAYAALASVASSLGKPQDAALLRTRALNYRNLFDPATHFLRPRMADGTWQAPFDPKQERGYVEGTAWHYRWLAPQDVAGLIRLFGGDDAFNTQLDAFFAYPRPGWTPAYYNPYNETDLEAPFLYDYSGAPWRTQAVVRKALRDVYKTTPDGIPGNDDCGTMSAWAIFGMIGLYPTDPARPAFELCSPVFDRVTLHLQAPHGGKTFVITAAGAAANKAYIQSARLNGSVLPRPWIAESAVAGGGTLNFSLGADPNRSWGTAAADRPPSLK